MNIYHNTRDDAFKSVRGAVATGTPVTIYVDVYDAPGATVTLRTWIEEMGESLVAMEPTSPDTAGSCCRYQATVSFDKPCIVWYHFIATDTQGNTIRYGAKEGQTGGVGCLSQWEPPSFQLTVVNPQQNSAAARHPKLCYHVCADTFFSDGEGGYKGFARKLDYLAKKGIELVLVDTSAAARKANDEKRPSLIDNKSFTTRLHMEAEKHDMSVIFDDASSVASFDHLRKYIAASGNETHTDSIIANTNAMDTLVNFVRNQVRAPQLVEALSSWYENYPDEAIARTFNLLGGPERAHLLTRLGAEVDPNSLPMEQRAGYRLPDHLRGAAKNHLWQTLLVQMLLPGNPVIYMGDEAGVEGFDGNALASNFTEWPEDGDCADIVSNINDMRSLLPLFNQGDFRCFAANDDVFGFLRADKDGMTACVLVNSSQQNAYDVLIPLMGEAVSEVTGGYAVPIVDAAEAGAAPEYLPSAERYAQVHLYQKGSAVLLFHPVQRLQREMEPGLGVLAHITSIPATNGPGTLGEPARKFVDWLAAAGVRYWQVLPVNPTDGYGSPYAGISAFAGETRLISGKNPSPEEIADIEKTTAFQSFVQREADWLEPYAAFMSIRETQKDKGVWQDWPDSLRRYDTKVIVNDEKRAAEARKQRVLQFLFQRQWNNLRSYANERGVQMVGDMPLYVNANSADAWAQPGIFQLDKYGMPQVVAGCPPDAFAVEGQIWGNPVYNWDALARDGYSWWKRRLARAFELYDIVRLDHFIGFARYFCVPVGKKATEGAYRPGPGLAFFQKMRKELGLLPVIAEDLGLITPAVRMLVAACGFPGMDIVQFADGNDPLSWYTPRPEKIAYSGTHDNQTLRGWAENRYPDENVVAATRAVLDKTAACDADVVIIPLQDILGLDDSARMNTPGTTEGNWTWQADGAAVEAALDRARELAEMHRRK